MSAASTIPVIFNPCARSAKNGDRAEELQALSPRIVLHPTQEAGDARRLAAMLAAEGAPVVVAAGGDGTINEVVNGLAASGRGAETALGLLPSGTMNVFAMDLGLPVERPDECWALIEGGQTREIDVWRANDEHFVQLAGAGLDARVIEGTTWESKKALGPLSYVLSAVQTLQKPAPLLTVRTPFREAVQGTVVLVGNGRSYGGPFRFFPAADFADGLLDVVVMRRHGLAEFMRLGMALVSGQFAPDGDVLAFKASELEITADEPVPFEADGELSGATPLRIRLADFRLRVLV